MCNQVIERLLNKMEINYNPHFMDRIDDNTQWARQNINNLLRERQTIKSHLGNDERLESTTDPLRNNPLLLKSLLKDQLEDIAKYDTGKQLLKEIEANLAIESRQTPFKIRITNMEKTRYDLQSNQLTLNFWDAVAAKDSTNNTLKFFNIEPLIHGQINIANEDFVESKNGLSPFFIGVFHELTHYNDAQKKSFERRDHRDTQHDFSRVFPILPNEPFGNFMEHRAIFDRSDGAISELRLRAQAKEPLKYLHSAYDEDMPIYEPFTTVIKKATRFVPKEQKINSAMDFARYLYRLPIKTNITEPYTPLMKTRLVTNFRENFQRHAQQLNNEHVENFVEYQRSPERIKKINSNIQRRQRLLSYLDNHHFSSLEELREAGFSPSQIAIAYEQSNRNKQQFINHLKRNLTRKLNQNEQKALNLHKMGFMGLFDPIPEAKLRPNDRLRAFRMLVGLESAQKIAY